MGVKKLWEIVSPVGRRISIQSLEHSTLAIDVSIWLVQFLKAMRDDMGEPVPNAHLIGTLRRVLRLLYHGIRPIFVFDGGVPAAKARLIRQRQLKREQEANEYKRAAQKLLATQMRQRDLKKKSAEATTFDPGSQKVEQQRADDDEEDVVKWEKAASSSSEEESVEPLVVGQDFDPESLAALPLRLRKEAVLATQRKHRVDTRRALAPKAADAEEYSKGQIANFLKGIKLRKKIEEAQKASEGPQGAGRRIHSDPGRRFILARHDDDDEPSRSRRGGAVGRMERFLEANHVIAEEDDDDDAPPPTTTTTTTTRRSATHGRKKKKKKNRRRTVGRPRRVAEDVFEQREIDEEEEMNRWEDMALDGSSSEDDDDSDSDSEKKRDVPPEHVVVDLRDSDDEVPRGPPPDRVIDLLASDDDQPVDLREEPAELSQSAGLDLKDDDDDGGFLRAKTLVARRGERMRDDDDDDDDDGGGFMTAEDEALAAQRSLDDRPRDDVESDDDGGGFLTERDEARAEALAAQRSLDDAHAADTKASREGGFVAAKDELLSPAAAAEKDESSSASCAWEAAEEVPQKNDDEDCDWEGADEEEKDDEAMVAVEGDDGDVQLSFSGGDAEAIKARLDALFSHEQERPATPPSAEDRIAEQDRIAEDRIAEDRIAEDRSAEALASAMKTADKMADWAGRAFRKALADTGMRLPERPRATNDDDGEPRTFRRDLADDVLPKDKEDDGAPISDKEDDDESMDIPVVANVEEEDEQPGVAPEVVVVETGDAEEEEPIDDAKPQGNKEDDRSVSQEFYDVCPEFDADLKYVVDNAETADVDALERDANAEEDPTKARVLRYLLRKVLEERQRRLRRPSADDDDDDDIEDDDEDPKAFAEREGIYEICPNFDDQLAYALANYDNANLGALAEAAANETDETRAKALRYVIGAVEKKRVSMKKKTQKKKATTTRRQRTEEEEDDAMMEDYAEEEERLELDAEVVRLKREMRAKSRDQDHVTEEMRLGVMQLLELLGAPYVIAPMEAEAQCAYLEQEGAVEGVVTDDSDAFVFGAKRIYKNIFEERRDVEAYKAADLRQEVGLERHDFITLALLLGGDYCHGVKNVGTVNAAEILLAFKEAGDASALDTCTRFKEWLDGGPASRLDDDAEKSSSSSSEADDDDEHRQHAAAKKRNKKKKKKTPPRVRDFEEKHRTARWRFRLPAGFPSAEAVEAYEKPKVATLAELARMPETTGVGRRRKIRQTIFTEGEPENVAARLAQPMSFFRWREPDEDALVRWCEDTLGWEQEKIERDVLPALRKHEERRSKPRATRVDAFFESYHTNARFATVKSKRLRRAFGMTDDDDDDDDESPRPRKLKKKAAPAKKKKKKQKRRKDPNAPKGKVSAFLFFSKERRAAVKEANPTMTTAEIAKELGRLWRDLGDSEKDPYTALAREDKDRYDREMATYRQQQSTLQDDDDDDDDANQEDDVVQDVVQDDDDDDDDDDAIPPPREPTTARQAATQAKTKLRRNIEPISDDDDDQEDDHSFA